MRLALVDSPCKDCPDRHMRCHCECEKYKVYKAESDRKRAEVNLEKAKKFNDIGYIKDSQERYRKLK